MLNTYTPINHGIKYPSCANGVPVYKKLVGEALANNLHKETFND